MSKFQPTLFQSQTPNIIGSFISGQRSAGAIDNMDIQNQSALQQMRARQEASARSQQIDRLSQEAQINPQAFNQLAAIAPQRAKQIQDIQITRSQTVGRIAQSFKSQSLESKDRNYPRVVQDLQSKGFDISRLPDVYDPVIVDPLVNQAVNQSRDVEKQMGQSAKFSIRDTEQGTLRINESTGEASPITLNDQNVNPVKKVGTTINMGEAETEEQKGFGKMRAKRFEDVMASGDSAQRGLETLQTLEQAVNNPEATQGAFATIRGDSKKIADLFGFETKGLKDDAIIASVGNKLALQLRSPKGEDGGLTGSTSDRDLKFLVAGVPNRDKTKEQNIALIEIGIRDKKRTIELKEVARQYLEENGTFAGFEKAKKEWLEENPLFANDENKTRIKKMLSSDNKKNTRKKLLMNKYGLE